MVEIPSEDEIVEILKEVIEPETELSVYELGLVKYIDYQEENKTLVIKCDFARRNPSCVGCVPIAWMLQKKVTDELSKRFMRFEGINSVEIIG